MLALEREIYEERIILLLLESFKGRKDEKKEMIQGEE